MLQQRHTVVCISNVDPSKPFKRYGAIQRFHIAAGYAQTAINETQASSGIAKSCIFADEDRSAVGDCCFTNEGMIINTIVFDGLLEARIGAIAVEQCLLLFKRQIVQDWFAIGIRNLAKIEICTMVVSR